LGYADEAQLMVSALSFVNTVYLARKYNYPVDEVYESLMLRQNGHESLIA
jgi:hypothetical protein